MCFYQLFIFMDCGHSQYSRRPFRRCARSKARIPLHREASCADKIASRLSDTFSQADTLTEEASAFQPSDAVECSGRNVPAPRADGAYIDMPALRAEDGHVEGVPSPQTDGPAVHAAEDDASQACCTAILTHPFLTRRIQRSCAACAHTRTMLLAQLDTQCPTVRFEDYRWKVKYLSPVPEEARYSEGGAGMGAAAAVGSWVKDWRVKGEGVLDVLREQVKVGGAEGVGRDRGVGKGGMGLDGVGVSVGVRYGVAS